MLRGHTPAAPVVAARTKRGGVKTTAATPAARHGVVMKTPVAARHGIVTTTTVVRIKPEEEEEVPPWAMQAVVVKDEERVVRVDPPWAMQAVVVKDEDGDEGRVVRVEPVRPETATVPWPDPPAIYPRPAPDPMHGPPQWTDQPGPPPKQPESKQTPTPSPGEEKGTAVCARNYAAVEAQRERYGLIDMGSSGGSQALVVHVRKRNREPQEVLNGIRQGCVLRARRRGRDADLRVRFVTPARYYSPGSKITTLCIGVDQSDWQSLIAAPPRI